MPLMPSCAKSTANRFGQQLFVVDDQDPHDCLPVDTDSIPDLDGAVHLKEVAGL
jgi:hypothetical protein